MRTLAILAAVGLISGPAFAVEPLGAPLTASDRINQICSGITLKNFKQAGQEMTEQEQAYFTIALACDSARAVANQMPVAAPKKTFNKEQ